MGLEGGGGGMRRSGQEGRRTRSQRTLGNVGSGNRVERRKRVAIGGRGRGEGAVMAVGNPRGWVGTGKTREAVEGGWALGRR